MLSLIFFNFKVVLAYLCMFMCFSAAVPCVRGYSVLPPTNDEEEKAMLHRMMRVDHAGEYGANRIYAGQMAVLGCTQTRPLIQVLAIDQSGDALD